MGRFQALLKIAQLEFHALGRASFEAQFENPVVAGAALPVGTKRSRSAIGEVEAVWATHRELLEQKKLKDPEEENQK